MVAPTKNLSNIPSSTTSQDLGTTTGYESLKQGDAIKLLSDDSSSSGSSDSGSSFFNTQNELYGGNTVPDRLPLDEVLSQIDPEISGEGAGEEEGGGLGNIFGAGTEAGISEISEEEDDDNDDEDDDDDDAEDVDGNGEKEDISGILEEDKENAEDGFAELGIDGGLEELDIATGKALAADQRRLAVTAQIEAASRALETNILVAQFQEKISNLYIQIADARISNIWARLKQLGAGFKY